MPEASGIYLFQRRNVFETVGEVASAAAGKRKLVHCSGPEFKYDNLGGGAVAFELYGTEASGCASSYDSCFHCLQVLLPGTAMHSISTNQPGRHTGARVMTYGIPLAPKRFWNMDSATLWSEALRRYTTII